MKPCCSHSARRSLHALCRILLAVHCMLCRRAALRRTRPFTCKAPISHPRMYVHTRNKHTIQHKPCDTKHAACNIRGDPSHSRRRSRAVRRSAAFVSPPKIHAARCNKQRRRTMGSFVGTGSRCWGTKTTCSIQRARHLSFNHATCKTSARRDTANRTKGTANRNTGTGNRNYGTWTCSCCRMRRRTCAN
jgi:hypothetical protein